MQWLGLCVMISHEMCWAGHTFTKCLRHNEEDYMTVHHKAITLQRGKNEISHCTVSHVSWPVLHVFVCGLHPLLRSCPPSSHHIELIWALAPVIEQSELNTKPDETMALCASCLWGCISKGHPPSFISSGLSGLQQKHCKKLWHPPWEIHFPCNRELMKSFWESVCNTWVRIQ